MIADLFLSVLEISMSASLIIAVLLLLAPLLDKRYAAKWKYWLWIFLALRLVIPYSGNEGKSVIDILSQMKMQDTREADEKDTEFPSGQAEPPRRIIVEIPQPLTDPITVLPEKSKTGVTVLDIIAFIWMSGGVVFLAVHLISYLRFKQQVSGKGRLIKDTQILRQMFRLKRELHIRASIPIVTYAGAVSPMMIGFFSPVLVLPDIMYSSEDLFFILKHELIHWKRKDVFCRLLFVAANAVHWFNPLVWIMQKEAAVDMELSCDEQVTRGVDYAVRKAYTETLLSTLHKQSTKGTILLTQFYGGKEIMKKRFKNILVWKRKKNGAVILLCAVILTLSLGTMIGCSAVKEDAEGMSDQAGNDGLGTEQDADETDVVETDESGTDDVTYTEDASLDNESDGNHTEDAVLTEDNAAPAVRTLTVMKEGEPEEKQASLVVEDGYSLYLPDGEWQKNEEGIWQAVVNDKVQIRVECLDRQELEKQIHTVQFDIEAEMDDGMHYLVGADLSSAVSEVGLSNITLISSTEEMIKAKSKLYEDGDNVWCVSYCYPEEAEEGWGRELPVIADTFAITES